MLNWIDDSNKYTEIYKAYFGSYEITIIKFQESDYTVFTRSVDGTSLCKCTYNSELSLEEVKAKYVEDLADFLDKRVIYWTTLQHSLYEEIFNEEDE